MQRRKCWKILRTTSCFTVVTSLQMFRVLFAFLALGVWFVLSFKLCCLTFRRFEHFSIDNFPKKVIFHFKPKFSWLFSSFHSKIPLTKMIYHKPFSGAAISILERNIWKGNIFTDPSIKMQSMAWPLRFPICRFWEQSCPKTA